MRQLLSLLFILSSLMFIGAEPAAPNAPDAQFEPENRPMVDNPQYVSWANHEVGSSVTAKSNADVGGQKLTVETIMTLIEKTNESVTVESKTVTTLANGTQAPPQTKTEKIASKVKQGFEYAPEGFAGKFEQTGTEMVTVAGKSFECRVFSIDGNGGGAQMKGKLWACDQVPGTQTKGEFEMIMEGTSMSFDLIVTEINLK